MVSKLLDEGGFRRVYLCAPPGHGYAVVGCPTVAPEQRLYPGQF